MRGYGTLTVVLAVVTLALGVALLAVTATHGGGQVGYILGVLFLALGVGRLYLARRRPR